jgi:hypothetical protein
LNAASPSGGARFGSSPIALRNSRCSSLPGVAVKQIPIEPDVEFVKPSGESQGQYDHKPFIKFLSKVIF